ncbi:hypothetical protein KDX01_27040 [Burkholderia vietnamiensis]|uniref:hypothetical protein n=1 Tax=Burkholderia vietnamiensis TaxID=60552 RepID=UPI001B90193B|nr:hypothetical protein [Burkholderia vietnamiensis]MBR7976760.1 hypothetical protein [Burkholderia vietnamiensis]
MKWGISGFEGPGGAFNQVFVASWGDTWIPVSNEKYQLPFEGKMIAMGLATERAKRRLRKATFHRER